MFAAFVLYVLASAALVVLSFPFVSKVRAARPDLLPALRLDDQPACVRYARWNHSLLPYSSFILRRSFTQEFKSFPDLLKISEAIFWLHLVQVTSLVSLVLQFIIGLAGATRA